MASRIVRYGLAFTGAVACGSFALVANLGAARAAGSFPAPTVAARGTAPAFAQLGGGLNLPVVDIASDPGGPGYWMVANDGGVFTSGHARFYGSTGAIHLTQPIVAMAPTPTGRGYWLVASDGGIFTFGDARFFGSLGALHLAAPIVSMAATPHGGGYWLVASDGGVFAFGSAGFYGSAASTYKSGSIVDIATTHNGLGYELLVSDGAVFHYGNAPALGNPTHGVAAAAIVRSPTAGYWVLTRAGRVAATNGASYAGAAPTTTGVALGLAPRNDGKGYWIATVPAGPPAPPNSGSGRRIIYSISAQRAWTIEQNNTVSHFWKVSGRTGAPPPGTYAIQSRSIVSTAGSLRLNHMERFYQARSGKWIGFHGIPLRPDGTPIESDAQLGTPLSHGCVRMSQTDATTLWNWASLGTTVVVLG